MRSTYDHVQYMMYCAIMIMYILILYEIGTVIGNRNSQVYSIRHLQIISGMGTIDKGVFTFEVTQCV